VFQPRWTFDARHNQPRIGRVLMAVGLDASDVALTDIVRYREFAAIHRDHQELPQHEAAYV
jgi:hypothetical protein